MRSLPWRPRHAAAVIVVVIFLGMTGVARSEYQDVIPPDAAQKVVALFAPFAPGDDVYAGYQLDEISIDGAEIYITLETANGRQAYAELRPATGGNGDSRSFRFQPGPNAGEAARAVEILLERVRANDQGGIYRPAIADGRHPPVDAPAERSLPTHDPLWRWAATAFLASLVAGAWRQRRIVSFRRGVAVSELPTPIRTLSVGQFAACWLLTVGLSLAVAPVPRLHHDSLQDYEVAQRCLREGRCTAHTTSVESVNQGRLLVFALVALERMGTTTSTHHLLFVSLTALSACVVLVLGRRLYGPEAGWLAWAFALCAGSVAAGSNTIWNPALAPLPLALFALTCAGMTRNRCEAWVWMAVLSVALAVQGHPVHFALAVVLAFICGVSSTNTRWVLIGAVAPATLFVAVEPDWTLANLAGFHSIGFSLPLVGGPPLAAIVGVGLRTRFLLLSPTTRERLAVFLPVAAVGATIAPAAILLDKPIGMHYLAAAVPGVAVALGALASSRHRLLQLLGPLVVVLAARAWILESRPPHRLPTDSRNALVLSLTDAEAIAAAALAAGYGPSDGPARLQGPTYLEVSVVMSLMSTGLPAVRDASGPPFRYLPVQRSRLPEQLPSGWQRIDLRHGRLALASTEAVQWIERQRFTVCAVLEDGRRSCHTADPDARAAMHEGAYHGIDRGQVREPLFDRRRERATRYEQELPIRLDGTEPEHTAFLARPWKVVAVDGVDHEILKDGDVVVLRRGTGLRGVLTVARASDNRFSVPRHSAVELELSASEDELRALAFDADFPYR